MTGFWEEKFKNKEMMWGQMPSDSAIIIKDFFLENKITNILLPGIGYGRNAKIFYDNGIHITGIEISNSAIKMAHKHISLNLPIHLGSVTEMPFDSKKYEGIFCYSLIHLLNKTERKNFIRNCYKQLLPNGYMFFVVVSKKENMFGKGKKLSKNRYEIGKGLNVYFYDELTIKQEFNDFGLISIEEIDEPIKYMEKEPPLKCFLIKCQQKT
jgi:SAM-dependent methyltransferase